MLLGDYWYNWVPAALVAVTGLAYIALEFVPSIEPPANMRYVFQTELLAPVWTLEMDTDIV